MTRSGASSAASGGTIRAPLIAARPAVPGNAAREEVAVTRVTEPLPRSLGTAARDPHLAELMRTFTQARRTALRRVLERGRERGELSADHDLDLMVDQVYGVFWYRFLLGHAPLDATTADRLTEALLR
ncbi:TetR-like C-terminal domain-containing protein [Streptomyces sp. NPDC046197]|uniref:TetR-like C-terminal domain-containing protein n=1 Tax=Streptomyces sp. NPDC046197 TaxID=3154337 RepID=UPI0033D13C90